MKNKVQSPIKRFFASRSFLLLALGLAILTAFWYARAYYQDYKLRQEIEQLQEEVKHFETKKLESMELLQYVMSSTYVEDTARTELNMKKPGEHVVFIEDLGNSSQDSSKSNIQAVDEQVLSNPLKWWYYFIHKKPPS